MKYKYDLHCHVSEGSDDSKVNAKSYIEKLIELGFTGFLITDHNTYKGYEYAIKELASNYNDFYILKGIEYSTVDAGHILVIMPDGFSLEDIDVKSRKLIDLIEYVHSKNGILGPAHPCSEPYLSIFNCKSYKNNYDILKQFDFIEVLNAGEKEEENSKAKELAKKYNLPTIGGSDSHHLEHCGLSYAEFNTIIKNNDELIDYIRNKKEIVVNGKYYKNYDREKYDRFGSIAYFYDHIKITCKK